MTFRVGFTERTSLGEHRFGHACVQCCVGHPAGPLALAALALMSEQPVEESLTTLCAVVVWRQVYVLGGLTGWV